MRKHVTLLALVGTAFMLTGCSGAPSPAEQADAPAAQEPAAPQPVPGDDFSFAHITSCDQLEPMLNTWVDGLVPYETNTAEPATVHCGWSSPPDEVDLDSVRSVEVTLNETSERPDYSMLESMDGFERISDPWVTEHDGEAFSLTVDIGLSAVIGTTIWVPGVEVSVAGGRWADLPELDGAAGAKVAKQILGA